MEQIQDGTGSGKRAKVDANNRLHTLAVIETIHEQSALQGDTYNMNTGSITLTSGSESALIYLKNNGDNDLHISSIGYLIGNSTGGAGDLEMKVFKNPTGGTIISNATAVDVNVNKNFGDSSTLTVDAYKGAEGNTVTGGTNAYYSLLPGDARSYIINTGTLVIPKGSSLAVTSIPQTGNTSMKIQVFLAVTEYKL